MKYRVIVQCILNSGWIPAQTEDMGGISAGQEGLSMLATDQVEFRMNPRRCWEMALADGFTFEQVGIVNFYHNLARWVLECAHRRALPGGIIDFESLTRWVSTSQKVVNSYQYLLVRCATYR